MPQNENDIEFTSMLHVSCNYNMVTFQVCMHVKEINLQDHINKSTLLFLWQHDELAYVHLVVEGESIPA